jgi:hypothetical protein
MKMTLVEVIGFPFRTLIMVVTSPFFFFVFFMVVVLNPKDINLSEFGSSLWNWLKHGSEDFGDRGDW